MAGGIEDRISQLLSSPEGLAQVMAMAKALGGDGAGAGQTKEAAAEEPTDGVPPPPPRDRQQTDTPPLSGDPFSELTKTLGLNASQLSVILGAISNMSDPNDPNTNLIASLRPYMSGTKSENVEGAVRAMRLAKMARSVLEGFGRPPGAR